MAVGLAKKEAGIDADEEVRFDVWPKKHSFWQAVFSRSGIGLDIKSAAGREKILDAVRMMNRTKIWAVMPFWVGPR